MLFHAVALAAALTLPAPGGLPWAAADTATLAADLDRIVGAAKTLRAAHVGTLVVAPDGSELYARAADATIQPASTMKLLVGSAALDRLGAAYHFTTTLTHAPLAGGDGEALVLHGGGDPLLRRADLDAAADAVRAAGIVRAQVTLDESHVAAADRRAPGWSVDDILQDYAPVVNGLPFEENTLALTLVPGLAPGLPPTLQLPPPFQPLTLAPGICRPGPTLLTFTLAARTVAAGGPDTSDVTAGPCGDVIVTGNVPLGDPSHVDAAIDQPEALALAYFIDALQKRGIAATTAPTAGAIPGVVDAPFTASAPGALVWRHDGHPLAALLADMWLPSDNLIAEELLREIDVAANARAGTIAGGAALERIWLRSFGVDPAALTIADGSGLSQYNRVTPRALVAVLLHDWRGPGRDAVLRALPVAGVRGDLRTVMRGTAAEGRVFAKTGSMSHVRGLAGYVATRTRGTVVFALSIDDWIGTDADLAAFRAAFCARLAAS